MRSWNEPSKVLEQCGLLLGASNEYQTSKNIWRPLLDSINSPAPLKDLSAFYRFFWHLNYHILMFFLAYIGLYRTPVGLHGQEPYLGPAHLWLWRNMDVWDKVIALKWGGKTNAHLKFSVSYKKIFLNIQLLESKKILRKFMIFFWLKIVQFMIEWTFALSDPTISFRYSYLGYKGIWVHENNFSGTIESSGTKFNYTQSKDLDALIQAFSYALFNSNYRALRFKLYQLFCYFHSS